MTQTAKVTLPSVTQSLAGRYSMTAENFERTLRATVVPPDCSKEQLAAFLLVANEYGLNPITKEIFAFPNRSGGIQPIVSVDGWCNLINSHPQCDGFEFDDTLDGDGNLISITCRMYRKDRAKPVTATEYMEECRRDTSTWKQWPRRMLRHKALIQAARYAFGFAGIVDIDEAEREHYAGTPGARLVPPPAPPPTPKPNGNGTVEAKAEPPAPEGFAAKTVADEIVQAANDCALEEQLVKLEENAAEDMRRLNAADISQYERVMDALQAAYERLGTVG